METTKRQGAALVRASQPYAKEQPLRTWWLYLSTVAIYAALLAYVAVVPWMVFKVAGSLVLGLVVVRLFIIYHDFQHGAIFRGSTLGRWAINWVGFLTQAPSSVWKETHDYHHTNNARLLGSAIGSYPLVTVNIWRVMKPEQKRLYRFIRHPLTIAFGFFTAFQIGFCYAAFKRDPRQHWRGPVAFVTYYAVFAALWLTLGLTNAFLMLLLPSIISAGFGAYLFYAQHNFPRRPAAWTGREAWNYHTAALRSSSDVRHERASMHWFTGNIGYHHVHHLNHRIPFYRLQEAMDALPELQEPIATSWAPSDVWACLRIGLWDPKARAMISLADGEAQLAARRHVAAAK